jgi:hypothetical protein
MRANLGSAPPAKKEGVGDTMRLARNLSALPLVVTVLGLGDGLLHLYLRFTLFGGGGARPPGGPAPGATPRPPGPGSGPPVRLPLPLPELFLLNFVGYIVLVLVFWIGPRWLGAKSWLIDVAFIIYTSLVILGWLDVGAPNPMGLGYLAKGIEIALIVALVVHAVRQRRAAAAM